MNRNSARLLAQNPQILKRLAKYMAQQSDYLAPMVAGMVDYVD
jgi:hypothetical protein